MCLCPLGALPNAFRMLQLRIRTDKFGSLAVTCVTDIVDFMTCIDCQLPSSVPGIRQRSIMSCESTNLSERVKCFHMTMWRQLSNSPEIVTTTADLDTLTQCPKLSDRKSPTT